MTQRQKIQLFEDKKVRTAWDDQEEKWYFSIVDVCGVLSESENPQTYWRVLKNRLKKEGNETVTNKQLLRCGTSIGANVCEGGRQYVNIALKEAGEVMEQREQSEACFDFAE